MIDNSEAFYNIQSRIRFLQHKQSTFVGRTLSYDEALALVDDGYKVYRKGWKTSDLLVLYKEVSGVCDFRKQYTRDTDDHLMGDSIDWDFSKDIATHDWVLYVNTMMRRDDFDRVSMYSDAYWIKMSVSFTQNHHASTMPPPLRQSYVRLHVANDCAMVEDQRAAEE